MQLATVAARLGLPATSTGAEILAAVDKHVATRRDRLIDDAVGDGRIAAASRKKWRGELDTDPVGTEATLAALKVIPATELSAAAAADGGRQLELARAAFGVRTDERRRA
jgi:hypothetical protein